MYQDVKENNYYSNELRINHLKPKYTTRNTKLRYDEQNYGKGMAKIAFISYKLLQNYEQIRINLEFWGISISKSIK